MKDLLRRFHMNGRTVGFYLQTQALYLPYVSERGFIELYAL